MISGYGTIASSDLFLLDTYQDRIDMDSNVTMTKMVIVGEQLSNYQNSEQESLYRGDEV